jgi:hypothetical protein
MRHVAPAEVDCLMFYLLREHFCIMFRPVTSPIADSVFTAPFIPGLSIK